MKTKSRSRFNVENDLSCALYALILVCLCFLTTNRFSLCIDCSARCAIKIIFYFCSVRACATLAAATCLKTLRTLLYSMQRTSQQPAKHNMAHFFIDHKSDINLAFCFSLICTFNLPLKMFNICITEATLLRGRYYTSDIYCKYLDFLCKTRRKHLLFFKRKRTGNFATEDGKKRH